jgi:hypothetical protein
VLYIVLALVLAAFGLLLAALTTAETLWAWISVVVSVAAAALLVMDWLKSRRAKRAADEPGRLKAVTVGGTSHHGDEPGPDDLAGDLPSGTFPPVPPSNFDFEPPVRAELPTDIGFPSDVGEAPVDERAERTEVTEAVAEDRGENRVDDSPDAPDLTAGEPGEEPTDASDLLVVAGLSAEVRVVDEHPRYHLATCVWLANRPTIPLPVSEARQLGFTPCARCGPDSVLAAKHRARAN